MLGRDISPNRLPRNTSPRLPIRPRSQDAAYRSRSPIAQAFFNNPIDKKREPEKEEEATEETQAVIESEHQLACPWNKVKKLRSRENAKSPNKDDLHPRPWGVRSPKEIPCTCKISKNEPKLARQNPLNFMPSISLKSPAHIEIHKAVDLACKEIDKVKILLTSEEVTEFSNKIKTALEKKMKPKGKPSERGTKQLKKASSLSSHQPKLNSTTIVAHKDYLKDKQMQSPPPSSRQIVHNTTAGDSVMLPSPPGAMTMRPTAVVGTMESTNYFIELSGTHPSKQNANDFKNIMTQVLPSVDKPKLVSVDGAYFAEVPNDFGVCTPANQVCPDSRLLGKRTENVTFYAVADKHPQNVIYAKPKSPYSNSKYIPVAKLPALGLPQTVSKQIVKK